MKTKMITEEKTTLNQKLRHLVDNISTEAFVYLAVYGALLTYCAVMFMLNY